MTSVAFEIHRAQGSRVEELSEDSIFSRIRDDTEFVAAMCGLETFDGALVIDGVSVVDDLGSAVQRLCFECVSVLSHPGSSYSYLYLSASMTLIMTSNDDSVSIESASLERCEFPRA